MKHTYSLDRSPPLPRSFYDRPTAIVARDLLGKILLRRLSDNTRLDGDAKPAILGGLIVETEAYLPEGDPACHSFRGPTPRSRTMFTEAGGLYVYSIHAKYCMNAVTEAAGMGCAVLLRAIEPLWGIEQMQQSRGTKDWMRLCRGPAMLCQALSIGREADGLDLTSAETIWISETSLDLGKWNIRKTPRIGIRQNVEAPLRFIVDGNPFVSGRRRDHSCVNQRGWVQEL